jgi:hypothetical protein
MADEQPGFCLQCGSQLVGVVGEWNAYISERDIAKIKSGAAIFGPLFGRFKSAVCLNCASTWKEIHNLASQDYELQVAKEKALTEQDFDRARELRDMQHEIRPRLETIARQFRLTARDA